MGRSAIECNKMFVSSIGRIGNRIRKRRSAGSFRLYFLTPDIFSPSPSDSHNTMGPEPHKINNVDNIEGDEESAVVHIDEDINIVDADDDNPRPVKVGLAAALASICKQTRLHLDSLHGQDQFVSETESLAQIFRDVVRDVYEHLPWDETRPKNEGGIYTGMTKRKRRTRVNAQTNCELNRKFGMSLTLPMPFGKGDGDCWWWALTCTHHEKSSTSTPGRKWAHT
jgi:hypothetical protein